MIYGWVTTRKGSRGTDLSSRVTIKSIARELGISHMTVSRALSDHPNVQQQTREKILNRARELGYVKSAAAKAMRGDDTKIVGLLLPNIVNEFYARYANAMALACEQHSFQLIIHLTNDDIELERKALERLKEIQARAVVMVPSPGGGNGANLNLGGMKIIQLIRRRDVAETNDAILVDDDRAIQEAVVHLAKKGHTSIAYIGADSDLSSGRQRLAAYVQGLTKVGFEARESLIHTASPSFEMGRESANDILDRKEATAMVCGGFEISNGALSALMARRLSPNTDIAFIGYGDPSFYSWLDGGVSTIDVPVEDLAHRAVALVDGGKNGEFEEPPGVSKFSANLTVRGILSRK